MKRRILSLAALLLIVLSVTAQAAETRMGGNPVLAFDGTTAQCTATCYGRSSSDKVTATLTLYRGTPMWSPGARQGHIGYMFLEKLKSKGEKPIRWS